MESDSDGLKNSLKQHFLEKNGPVEDSLARVERLLTTLSNKISELPTKDQVAAQVAEIRRDVSDTKLDIEILSSKFDNVGIKKHNATPTGFVKLKAPTKTVKDVFVSPSLVPRSAKLSDLDNIPKVGEQCPILAGADMGTVCKLKHSEIISIMHWYNEDMNIAAEDDIGTRRAKVQSWLTGINECAALVQPSRGEQGSGAACVSPALSEESEGD